MSDLNNSPYGKNIADALESYDRLLPEGTEIILGGSSAVYANPVNMLRMKLQFQDHRDPSGIQMRETQDIDIVRSNPPNVGSIIKADSNLKNLIKCDCLDPNDIVMPKNWEDRVIELGISNHGNLKVKVMDPKDVLLCKMTVSSINKRNNPATIKSIMKGLSITPDQLLDHLEKNPFVVNKGLFKNESALENANQNLFHIQKVFDKDWETKKGRIKEALALTIDKRTAYPELG